MYDANALVSSRDTRSSFTIADDLTRTLKDCSVVDCTPKRGPLQDATNFAALRDDLACWSDRPKKRLKENSGKSVYTSLVPTPQQRQHQQVRAKEKEKTPTPPQYSSALLKLSQTIDAGVSECMECLSQLKSHANQERPRGNVFERSTNLTTPSSSASRGQLMGALTTETTPLSGAGSDSGGGSVRTPYYPHPHQRFDLDPGRTQSSGRTSIEHRGVSTDATPPATENTALAHSFQLACAQNLIEEGLVAMGSGEKSGARERIGQAVEIMESVLSHWREEEQIFGSRGGSVTKAEAASGLKRTVQFSSPGPESGPILSLTTPAHSDRITEMVSAAGASAGVRTGASTCARGSEKRERETTPENKVNLEDISRGLGREPRQRPSSVRLSRLSPPSLFQPNSFQGSPPVDSPFPPNNNTSSQRAERTERAKQRNQTRIKIVPSCNLSCILFR